MNFSNIKSLLIPEGVVKQITTSLGVVLWLAQTGPTDYSKRYLTLVARDSGTLLFDGTTDGTTTNTIQYSTDNGQTWSTAAQSATVNVNNGDKVLWKGEMVPYSTSPNFGIGKFTNSTASFDIEGNIMSLLYGDNFEGQTNLTGKTNAFIYIFLATKCVNSNNLILPAIDLAESCYTRMFYNCSLLVNSPVLPASTLQNSCYNSMFYECTSLTTAPALLGRYVALSAYLSMFYGCTSLTTAPALPATGVGQSGYYSMFSGCTSLTAAPVLPAMKIETSSYERMFYGCTSLTSAPALPATSIKLSCYDSMFYGCTSLSSAPDLPATSSQLFCYSLMFEGCTALTTGPIIALTSATKSSCSRMFYNCSSLNYITSYLHSTTNNYTKDWVYNVAATGIFVNSIDSYGIYNLPTGVNGIPSGWTVIYYDTTEDKYYLDQQKSQECDDHGNAI